MQNIKVIETARKFLIDIMGEDNFVKLISDGKIEIVHKKGSEEENIYELFADGKIINKTMGGKYCIDGGDLTKLPLHDQIAIKYAYLKNDIDRVESIANKTGIDGSLFRIERRVVQCETERVTELLAERVVERGAERVTEYMPIGPIPIIHAQDIVRETEEFLYVHTPYGGEIKIGKNTVNVQR